MVFGGLLEEMLLRESASVENVVKAMDNHSKVIINYHSNGKDEHSGTRVIEPITWIAKECKNSLYYTIKNVEEMSK